jgi:MFS family permease
VLFGLFANSLPLFILTWTFMVAAGANIGGFAPNWAAINNWFVRRKGQAMGFGMAAQSLGGVILAPVLAFLIARWDWRTAAVVAGVMLALVVLPVARVVRTRPEEMGQRPDGDSLLPEVSAPLGGAETSQKSGTSFRADVAHFTVRQAARTPALWFLIFGMGLRQFGQSSLMLHLSPLLQDRGFDPVQAGAMVGLVASMGIVGAVVSGWVSDRFPRHRVMAIIVSVEVVAILSLVLADQTWQVYPFLLAYGFGLGAHALNRAILGEYFGQDHYAKIWGLISMTATPLAAAGPVYAGWVFDTTQEYTGALLTYVVAYAVAALFYLYCRRPQAPVPDAGRAGVP